MGARAGRGARRAAPRGLPTLPFNGRPSRRSPLRSGDRGAPDADAPVRRPKRARLPIAGHRSGFPDVRPLHRQRSATPSRISSRAGSGSPRRGPADPRSFARGASLAYSPRPGVLLMVRDPRFDPPGARLARGTRLPTVGWAFALMLALAPSAEAARIVGLLDPLEPEPRSMRPGSGATESDFRRFAERWVGRWTCTVREWDGVRTEPIWESVQRRTLTLTLQGQFLEEAADRLRTVRLDPIRAPTALLRPRPWPRAAERVLVQRARPVVRGRRRAATERGADRGCDDASRRLELDRETAGVARLRVAGARRLSHLPPAPRRQRVSARRARLRAAPRRLIRAEFSPGVRAAGSGTRRSATLAAPGPSPRDRGTGSRSPPAALPATSAGRDSSRRRGPGG